MVNTNQIAEIGLLVGEPSRAAMLSAMMNGQAFTASELARCANITRQTASTHLARMSEAQLITVSRQGRHRYHRLASAEIAQMLEGIMNIASGNARTARPIRVGPRDEAMRRARTCYDHFAGRLGIAIADALIEKDLIEFDDDTGLVSDKGMAFLHTHHIEMPAHTGSRAASRKALCRPCMDWSERRPHVAGKVGTAICSHFIDKKLVRRINNTRAIEVTPRGKQSLRTLFAIETFD